MDAEGGALKARNDPQHYKHSQITEAEALEVMDC